MIYCLAFLADIVLKKSLNHHEVKEGQGEDDDEKVGCGGPDDADDGDCFHETPNEVTKLKEIIFLA
jgi:hypothetical protein